MLGAATLSWFARRMSRLDRLLRRLGVAIFLRALLETKQGAEARIDRRHCRLRLFCSGRTRADTFAALGTQGNHGDGEQELVADQVVQYERFAVVGDHVGRFGVGVVVATGDLAHGGAGDGQGPTWGTLLRLELIVFNGLLFVELALAG